MDDEPVCFYSDPVDEDGNVIAAVTVHSVTSTSYGPIPAVKIPHAEMALPPDTPVFRLEDDDA